MRLHCSSSVTSYYVLISHYVSYSATLPSCLHLYRVETKTIYCTSSQKHVLLIGHLSSKRRWLKFGLTPLVMFYDRFYYHVNIKMPEKQHVSRFRHCDETCCNVFHASSMIRYILWRFLRRGLLQPTDGVFCSNIFCDNAFKNRKSVKF